MDDESVIAKGLCERIGIDGSKLTHQPAGKDKYVVEHEMPDHTVAIKLVMDALVDPEHGVIKSTDEIAAVGHRVLHAGTVYSDSIIVNEDVKRVIRECFDLGPLHNPANLMGIEACEKAMPGKPNVAVWDTGFGMKMPEKAYLYAIPHEYYEKYSIRRYGFQPYVRIRRGYQVRQLRSGERKGDRLPLRQRRKRFCFYRWQVCRYQYGSDSS